jgi:thioredoxin-like negative regulator of GroEL
MNDFFQRFSMQPVDGAGFDAALEATGDALVAVYFWGEDCFNCEQFKRAATLKAGEMQALSLHWLQADVYAEPALGQRFGLHGVPAFFFFHRGRKLGRITGWPGWPAFNGAVADLRRRTEIRAETPENGVEMANSAHN